MVHAWVLRTQLGLCGEYEGEVVLGIPNHIWENNIVVQLEGLGGIKSLRFWICFHLAHGKISDAASCVNSVGEVSYIEIEFLGQITGCELQK